MGVLRCLVCLVFVTNFKWIFAEELACCSLATGSCRSYCEKISLVGMAADFTKRNESISRLGSLCSPQLFSFWECFNNTIDEIARGDSWPGRICCTLPQSDRCRTSCARAQSRSDLRSGCRHSDELAFFSCLERLETGADCCAHAQSKDCENTCWSVFKSHRTPNREQRNRLQNACEDSSKVMQCVRDFVKVTPAQNAHKHLHCCDKAPNSQCREACRRSLKSKTTHQEIIDNLQEVCGPPLFQDTFWQCFLQTADSVSTVEVSRIDRLGMDSAKLHCCNRAGSTQCRKLCAKTFTNEWSRLWEEFDEKCLSQLGEEDLRNCIDEVEEPCELGCDGLSYCTNFNNRPTELFRSCTPQADAAARSDVAFWQKEGYLTLPGLHLSVLNISRCSPNTWKAVACTLQIKPCSRHFHANQICRDVCLNILNECTDWSKMPAEYTAESLCARMSPSDPNTPCISLENFMQPSEPRFNALEHQIISPCKANPCGSNQICSINRNCLPGQSCQPYICTPGCKLGEVSQYVVPEGAYVRIPIVTGQNGCLKICRCSNGNIGDCQPLPCFMLDPCWFGKDKIDHGASFYMDCNMCSCFAGEIICSKRQCDDRGLIDHTFTTLPCNCPVHYVPVCGRNGVTYPNLCLAKCAGLSDADITFGACEKICSKNPCPIGQECVSYPKICLSLMHKPCKQYECINATVNCSRLPVSPVCDINNQEHPNSCYLTRRGKKLAYRGPCLHNCDHTTVICGVNGKTYPSECAAIADYTTIDYIGPCRTVGLIGDVKTIQCENVECAALPSENCVGYTPPGACCPVCGGVIRFLYSRKQIDRALYALQGHSLESLTLKSILRALERQIQVAQCSLSGYLSVELDIVVIVKSTISRPSELQLEACVREAEKLASLVRRQSPRVASELSLSALTASSLVHTVEHANSSAKYNSLSLIIIVLSIFLRIV